jgi:uncharacterized oxidoreductase
MNLFGNTMLITGGATGIGFALADEFLRKGNTVIICGRRADRLEQAQKALPGLIVRVCDVTDQKQREALFAWATTAYPALNVLVNNAGIQRDLDFTRGLAGLDAGESEIEVNLVAPVELSALFVPFLMQRENAAIINVSSGLALRPQSAARMPVYTATKAGLHAFSLSLRAQLKDTGVEVVEIIPPAVISELNPEGRRRRGSLFSGLSAGEYAAGVIRKMEQGEVEILP